LNHLADKYLQQGCLTKKDKLLSLISKNLPYQLNATVAANSFKSSEKKAGSAIQKVKVKPYTGNNHTVLKIKNYILSNLYNDLTGAYVHGSVATEELINYSDFDGLLIVKEEVLNSPSRLKRLALHLEITQKMALELDPFQHHGWMLLAENDLYCYDDSKFPLVLFDYAASLLDKGNELSFSIDSESSDYLLPFTNLTTVLLKKISEGFPQSLYEIKLLLSEFMLLPALYIQAKDHQGIFKKFSFKAAAADFSNNDWSVMDDVSVIRQEWNYQINTKRERMAWELRRIPVISKFFRTVAPETLQMKIDNKILLRMKNLIELMANKIKA
jgi:predicted nucleotidyltransferase